MKNIREKASKSKKIYIFPNNYLKHDFRCFAYYFTPKLYTYDNYISLMIELDFNYRNKIENKIYNG